MSAQNITTYSTETFFEENEPEEETDSITVQADMEAVFAESDLLHYNMIVEPQVYLDKTSRLVMADPTDPPLDDL